MSTHPRLTVYPAPSIAGSAPVHEVLSRIQVRDPQHTPSGIYGRRLTDYQSHWPALEAAIVMTLAVFLVGSSGWLLVRKFADAWTFPAQRSSAPAPLSPTPELLVPSSLHIAAQTAAERAPTRRIENAAVPQNLKAVFMGPRLIEFKWVPINDEYEYRLYIADDLSMKNARPLMTQPTPTWSTVWTADDPDIHSVWAAVKGVAKDGRETAFSRPINVQLP